MAGDCLKADMSVAGTSGNPGTGRAPPGDAPRSRATSASPVGSLRRPGHPNVVVIVLDCVRADDFERLTRSEQSFPAFARLRRESVVFPRAAAVAPWTVPSHATLFTGLYPWEHRGHAKGELPLSPTIPRLPAMLHEAGYASLSLSANPLVNPELGLLGGFDAAAWSEWWEPYIRNTPSGQVARPLIGGRETTGGPASRLQKLHDSPLIAVLHKLAGLVYRYPFVLDAANRVLQKIVAPEVPSHSTVARWVDPTLAQWLASVPPEQAIFTFVNLLEAHEPYYVDPSVVRNLSEYLRYVTTWQDRPSVLNGRWVPTGVELDLLHRLFDSTFQLLDRRVGGIVEALEAAGRWDDTLLIVTSDHGQAFLEKGTLFHMHRPDDELLRVPLWVRYPRNERGGTTALGWASLVDVAPTVMQAAGLPIPASFSGLPLPTLEAAERPGPVLAMADGLALPQERNQIPADRMAWIDRLWAAGYEADRKVTLDVKAQKILAYDLDRDPGEGTDLWTAEQARFAQLATAVARVGEVLSGAPSTAFSAEVEERLRSWGYL
jgi:arylsulfatase A-like enzyme